MALPEPPLTNRAAPVVNEVAEMFRPLPDVAALATMLTALPAVVFAPVTCSTLAAPVVLEPVILTTLPVYPVVVPDWKMFRSVDVV